MDPPSAWQRLVSPTDGSLVHKIRAVLANRSDHFTAVGGRWDSRLRRPPHTTQAAGVVESVASALPLQARLPRLTAAFVPPAGEAVVWCHSSSSGEAGTLRRGPPPRTRLLSAPTSCQVRDRLGRVNGL